jgi:HD-like signal output (HDOD) protein
MNRLQAFGLIVAQASRGELVFPNSVNGALKLQLALADPDCHTEEAIRLVLGDPLLAARTVALANSVVFNRAGETPITSARTAILRMGYRNLYTLVAAMVVRQFGAKIADPVLRIKAEQLWEHTIHVATLAHAIARHVTYVDADTAMFAGIVHEVGGFYLLSRADDFPGLLDGDTEDWVSVAEEVICREVMRKLLIPEPVSTAIEGMRDSLLAIPPDSLLDTLLLAKQLAPVASPLRPESPLPPSGEDAVIDFVIDRELMGTIMAESDAAVRAMNAALLV